jgi:ribosomal protein S27AE
MSFSMTTEAYRDYWKDVTRRLGWSFLKVGDVFMGVEQAQGLKKGEHVVRLHPSRVVAEFWQPLEAIESYPNEGRDECAREAFPGMTGREFVDMFTAANRCRRDEPVHRIEFEHECPECEGSGIGRFPERYVCQRCGGTGWVKGRAITETCEEAMQE